MRREGLKDGGKVSACGRRDRHDTSQALDVIGTSPVVPKDPSSVHGPRGCFADQIAAVGTNDQARFDQRVKRPTHTRARAPVVKNHQLRKDASVPEPHTSGTANVCHCLLQTSTRVTTLEHIASRKRGHTRDQHAFVLRTHQR